MLLVVLLGSVVGVIASFTTQQVNPELSKVFAAGAATLWFGSLLGGVVSLLIADVDRGRLVRAAGIEFVGNVLTDLKSVHDQVDRGRSLLAAFRSARTYRDVMLGLISARVKLRQVLRATTGDPRGESQTLIRDDVKTMESYLDGLVREFEQQYKDISREQSRYEAAMRKAEQSLPEDTPWAKIKALANVRDFLAPPPDGKNSTEASSYKRDFLDPLDRASEKLRKHLMALYGK